MVAEAVSGGLVAAAVREDVAVPELLLVPAPEGVAVPDLLLVPAPEGVAEGGSADGVKVSGGDGREESEGGDPDEGVGVVCKGG